MTRPRNRTSLILAAILLCSTFSIGTARAATFILDTPLDGTDLVPGDGLCASTLPGSPCTLRAAVQETNALAGPDSMVLPMFINVELTIGGPPDDVSATGDLDITDELVIDGSPFAQVEQTTSEATFHVLPGASLQLNGFLIEGGGVDNEGVLQLQQMGLEAPLGIDSSGTLTIDGLDSVGSRAISVLAGTALLENVTISGHNGYAIVNDIGATATLRQVSIDGSSGTGVTNSGIVNGGEMVIEDSAIINHFKLSTALLPGFFVLDQATGVLNSGSMSIARSRILGNTWGVPFAPGAGAVYNEGTLIVANSTIASNSEMSGVSVGAGGLANYGTATLSFVTFVDNACESCAAGDLLNSGQLTVSGSLLQSFSFNDPPCAGTVTSEGHNTEAANSCGLSEPSDLVNTSVTLTSMGTHFVPDLGPEIAGASSCTVLTDQLGNPRPFGGDCDRGAIEVGSPSGPVCGNGVDDDGDGLADLQDPGCRHATDATEIHLRPGDYVYSNFSHASVGALDGATGRLTPFAAIRPTRNTYDLEVDADGLIVVNEYDLGGTGAVSEIDPDTGTRAEISTGGSLVTPAGLAIDANGDLFVGESTNDVILHVDRLTGIQTPLSLAPDPLFPAVDDLLVDPADGSLLVSDILQGTYRVTDPLGTFSVASVDDSADDMIRPRQIALLPSGDVAIADENADRPVRLDPSAETDVFMLTTTPFDFMWGAAVEPSGLALFSDRNTGLFSRVDESGDTATPINFGHAETGIAHLAAVPDDYDLTLELTDILLVDGGDLGVVDVGDTLELTAVVTNTGAGSADLLSLESGLDPNLTLVGGSLATSQGSIIEGSLASDPRLEVDLGTLAPAASATVTWEVVVGDPAPASHVTANAWIRREKLILAESDDPTTGPAPDPNVIGVGDFGVLVQAVQKVSDTRGQLSGTGNPGSLLSDVDFFGASLEPVPDLDGDGIPDLIAGAYEDDSLATAGGAIYFLFMNADGTVKQRIKKSPADSDLATAFAAAIPTITPQGGDRFGSNIAYLGDLDGAGPADFALAVSAWYDDGLGTNRGAVYILFMQQSPLQVLSASEISDGVGGFPAGQLGDSDFFGRDVEAIGDVDGDGVVDLAVGAHQDDTIGFNSGGVWILFLNQSGTVKASPPAQILVTPSAAGDLLGLGIASLGLFDGDAVPDIAVGASRRDTGGLESEGAVFILTLNANGTIKTQTEIAPGVGGMPASFLHEDERFGLDVETLPDLDGDGVVELAVGANRNDDAGEKAGAVYVLYLTPSGTTDRVVQLAPQSGLLWNELDEGDRFGVALAPLGDLDSDGSPELAVGALSDDDGGDARGGVYVLYTVPEPGFGIGLAVGVGVLAAMRRTRTGSRDAAKA